MSAQGPAPGVDEPPAETRPSTHRRWPPGKQALAVFGIAVAASLACWWP